MDSRVSIDMRTSVPSDRSVFRARRIDSADTMRGDSTLADWLRRIRRPWQNGFSAQAALKLKGSSVIDQKGQA